MHLGSPRALATSGIPNKILNENLKNCNLQDLYVKTKHACKYTSEVTADVLCDLISTLQSVMEQLKKFQGQLF
jgi:hypothetical protein